MYRPASRYDSRSILEKPSRSARSTWLDPQDRSYSAPVVIDERSLSRDPYLSGDALGLDRDFRLPETSSHDLREAQRLAASFFSQYPPSTSAAPVYRDSGTSTRPLSPEARLDRYSARGQYRDPLAEDLWPDISDKEPLYSSRSQLVLEDWEEDRGTVDRRERVDVFGLPSIAPRGGKREDGGWDDYDYGVPSKEGDYPIMAEPESLRVAKRVDWTGLLPAPDGGRGEAGINVDTSLNKRASQNYRGGRQYLDTYHDGIEEELTGVEPLYSQGGGQYGDQYRSYLNEREDNGVVRNMGSRRDSRSSRGSDDWGTVRESSIGRGTRGIDTERGRSASRYDEERDPRRSYRNSRPSPGRSRSGRGLDRDLPEIIPSFRRGKYDVPKRDFSNRASITNRDILAVYYGNPGENQTRTLLTRRNFSSSAPSWYDADLTRRSAKWRPGGASGPPFGGRSAWYNAESSDPSRKGKKRWEKSRVEGTEVKRFKKETKSDKLFLMHNSRALMEDKDKKAAPAEKAIQKTRMREEKSNEAEAKADADKAEVKNDAQTEPTGGLWDNDDSWSDSEGEGKPSEGNWGAPSADEAPSAWGQGAEVKADADKNIAVEAKEDRQPEPTDDVWKKGDSWSGKEGDGRPSEENWDAPSTDEVLPARVQATDEEREQAAFQTLQTAAGNGSKTFFGECSEDEEDDYGQSVDSALDDEMDDICVHQSPKDDAVGENPDSKVVVPLPSSGAQTLTESGGVATLSVIESHDSEMVDLDVVKKSEAGKEVDASLEGNEEGEKKKMVMVVDMAELKESVMNREDKAFDFYVSLFQQDTELMKLYEADINCGSFECLVCAGVGVKRKKRFPDIASLLQHAKKVLRTKKVPEHHGFARAVSKVLGWETAPEPAVIIPRCCITPQESEPKDTQVVPPDT